MAFDQLQKILDAGGLGIINLGAPSSATDATQVTATASDIQPTAAGAGALGASFKAAPANHIHVDLLSKTTRFKATGALPACTAAGSGVGKTLTANANGAFPTTDGVSPNANDRILEAHQATGADNGIYTLTTVGSAGAPWVLTRAADFDSAAEVVCGAQVHVEEGTSYSGSIWTLRTANAITVDTTALTFRKTGGRVSVITLTDASTVAIDASLFSISGEADIGRVTITAARTMGNWTNTTDGQRIQLQIKASGGAFTPVGDTNYRFGASGEAPTAFPSIASGKTCRALLEYHGGDAKIDVTATANGY